MPIGGMMTLDDVVRAGQEGADWKSQREEQQQRQAEMQRQRAEAERQRQIAADADAAFAGVVEKSKAEWAAAGAQGQYKPSDETMMAAAEARGAALARAGDWKGFVQNEAAVSAQRLRVRQSALQQYETDGDVETLARRIYPTVFDGKKIVGTERIAGGPLDAPKGAPTGPDKIRLKFDDGSVTTLEPQALVANLKRTLIDPQKAMEQEILVNAANAKAKYTSDLKKDEQKHKGDQDRETERLRQEGRMSLAEVTGQTRRDVAETGAESREKVARIRTEAGGSGGGGRGGGDNSRKLQSTKVDGDGYIVGVFRDGSTRRLTDGSGKPWRSGDWAKRVDKLAKELRDAPGNFDASAADLRRKAEEALGSGQQQNPQPSGKDYSNLWGAKPPAPAPSKQGKDYSNLWSQ